MKLTVEVEIDEKLIAETANDAVRGEFESPSYGGNRGGAAYEIIKRAAKQILSQMDFEPLIRAEVDRIRTEAIGEILNEELRKEIRKQIKERREAGKVFGKSE